MKELKGSSLFLIGITMFAMFFGAGNLIFPPLLAAQAGTATWFAMLGFAITAIGFPILGVIAVAHAGGLKTLAGRVNPLFASIYTILIFLSIGPCLAIPRTASTSFSMAVTPFVSGEPPMWLFQLLYSVAFFLVAIWLALRPEKLTERLGKILCPALVVLIVAVFIGVIVNPIGFYGPVRAPYLESPAINGFLGGYQTMDTIAALNFGAIIVLNIRAKGVTDQKSIVKIITRAGWIAGGAFLLIYSMLAHIGAMSGGAFPDSANGADVLTKIVSALYGPVGSVLLGGIFVIACLNTCVSLLSSCSEYFNSILPKFSYRSWVLFFAVASMVVSNAGLDAILKFSVPVLNMIYPVSLVLITLGLCHKWLAGRRYVYPVTIAFTGVTSVIFALDGLKIFPAALSGAINLVPLAPVGLGWLIPAAIGLVLGLILSGKATGDGMAKASH